MHLGKRLQSFYYLMIILKAHGDIFYFLIENSKLSCTPSMSVGALAFHRKHQLVFTFLFSFLSACFSACKIKEQNLSQSWGNWG